MLALAFGSPRQGEVHEPRKILVIRRNGIGDMICALPLIRHLHGAWPSARIDVLASPRNAPILGGVPLVSGVHLYRRGAGLMRNHYLNLRPLLRPIRDARYDLAIAANGRFSKLVAVSLTRRACRAGSASCRARDMRSTSVSTLLCRSPRCASTR